MGTRPSGRATQGALVALGGGCAVAALLTCAMGALLLPFLAVAGRGAAARLDAFCASATGTAAAPAATAATAGAAPSPTPRPSGTASGTAAGAPGYCFAVGGPSGDASGVARAAYDVARLLSGSPDLFYSDMPAPILSYWRRTCPGCPSWRNGNLQCGMFVAGVYALAGVPLPDLPDRARDFWPLYAGGRFPGWREIAAGEALPAPGDMLVLERPGVVGDVGHVAIAVDVHPPTDGHSGALIFAQANGPSPIGRWPIRQDLSVAVPWSGYLLLGFIRPPAVADPPPA